MPRGMSSTCAILWRRYLSALFNYLLCLLFLLSLLVWISDMDITVAYFHPLFHPEVMKRDFEQIRAVGAGSIVYALHEQEEPRWPRDLERGFRLAQRVGLKVHMSLGRFGNLFAGPSLMP